ncbi:NUDIX hydrolase [Methylomicrobium sp. Wu6]|uniref:NUDIX hydrolase n=1 Tax=Methylomicrobium sp. Wu6 TaxID=3107928 RepID=UPI002DD64362|nr:NUDIX hydrolase [Methylomicrobium sp. Wu6]MEC4747165.1 NUDIX hydrolase [Methylomicrobium sp. Wu6]
MAQTQHNPQTVLLAISSLLSYHDKEDYEGVYIVVRQRDGLFDFFAGGSADDPDYADEWAVTQFLAQSYFEDLASSGKTESPSLQVVNPPPSQAAELSANTGINMRQVRAETLRQNPNLLKILGADALDIENMKHIHPRPDDNGKMVTIVHPSIPSPLTAFADPQQIAVVVPDGKTPSTLNEIALTAWDSLPESLTEWVHVTGQTDIDEPPMQPKPGKKLSAGVVTVEPDGRFWLVAPTNAFGGYKATYPKGTIEAGMPPQASAIKETFEESGLQVEITGWIGDFERTTSVTRYYFARRVSGNPAAMGWESQAVMLVPKDKMRTVLNHAKDYELLTVMLAKYQAAAPLDNQAKL